MKVPRILHSNTAKLMNVNIINWYTAKVIVIQKPHTCDE
ncbi:hypothetical protein DFQ00_106335 [Paenibacillus barcinonensis]|uniref:Uncharacterized protein n=1 Tax=Paenibacillus barcinonensis TaxID=198119 RepID=A0A2V4VS96_PAEBA|nr:hypothetical protein DFQ00_106335 [Paenibacillus barcinonensis]